MIQSPPGSGNPCPPPLDPVKQNHVPKSFSCFFPSPTTVGEFSGVSSTTSIPSMILSVDSLAIDLKSQVLTDEPCVWVCVSSFLFQFFPESQNLFLSSTSRPPKKETGHLKAA